MDGAGKSTAAQTAKTHLEAVGVAVGEIVWGRVDQEGAVLDKIAVPIKRLLGVGTTLADPVAAGGPTVAKQRAPAASWVRRLGLAWLWTAVVAAINARSQRLAARPRLGGTTILCDRWLVDSLVDLRVRYGRHRLAEWILRVASPAPDLAILIEVGHITAAQRKPGHQATRVLVAMEGLYAAAAERHGLVKVDARVASETVQDQIRALIDALLASH
jgi:thymidylate kinase